MTEKDIRMLLINVHAANVDILQRYTIAMILGGSEEHTKVVDEKLQNRMSAVQKAYWINNKSKRLQGLFIQNSRAMLNLYIGVIQICVRYNRPVFIHANDQLLCL